MSGYNWTCRVWTSEETEKRRMKHAEIEALFEWSRRIYGSRDNHTPAIGVLPAWDPHLDNYTPSIFRRIWRFLTP